MLFHSPLSVAQNPTPAVHVDGRSANVPTPTPDVFVLLQAEVPAPVAEELGPAADSFVDGTEEVVELDAPPPPVLLLEEEGCGKHAVTASRMQAHGHVARPRRAAHIWPLADVATPDHTRGAGGAIWMVQLAAHHGCRGVARPHLRVNPAARTQPGVWASRRPCSL